MPHKSSGDGKYKASGPLALWLFDFQESFENISKPELYDRDKLWDAFLILTALSMGMKAKLRWEKGWFSRSKARRMETLLRRFKDNEISYLDVFDYMAENLSIEAMRLMKEDVVPNVSEILFAEARESNVENPTDNSGSEPNSGLKLVKVNRHFHYPRTRFPVRWFGAYGNSVLMKFGISSDIKLNDFPGVVLPGLNWPKEIFSTMFLSYSHADKEFAKKLARDLLIGKVAIWFDEAEIRVGDCLPSKILTGIEEMEYFGVVLSPNAINSAWVTRELEAARTLESSNSKPKILPILYQPCDEPDCLRDRIRIDFTTPDKYKSSFDTLLNTLLDLPEPVYMTAKEAARLVKAAYDPHASLCGLSQQGICQQCISEQIRLRNDWHYADAKSGRSAVWILEYYDPSAQTLHTYGVIDGRVTDFPSGTLDGGVKVIDFNFIDSDLAVSTALETVSSASSGRLDGDCFFVETMLKYCEPLDNYLWFVLFFDVTLTDITYVVEINPHDGSVARSYKPSELSSIDPT
jgi:hypothetical protein